MSVSHFVATQSMFTMKWPKAAKRGWDRKFFLNVGWQNGFIGIVPKPAQISFCKTNSVQNIYHQWNPPTI